MRNPNTQIATVENKDIAITAETLREQAKDIFELMDISEGTRADYKSRIGLFIGFTKDGHFNRNSFLEFKRYLAERTDIGVATKNKYLASPRIFLKELNKQGMLPVDITQNVKSFKQSKKHRKDGLSEKEIKKLTDKMSKLPCTPPNTRLKAILALLTLQGLRQVELTRLDVADIDFIAKTAFVQGKGQDDKELIHLHPETVKAVREYLKVNNIASGALFISNSNNSKNKRISTRAIRGFVTEALHALDIQKTTHGFRHFFTTMLVKTYKGDLLEVAHHTRHKSLEMLQVYNDAVQRKADLPRYYKTFEGVKF
ncbi:hypothetical protein LCGC14_1072610 [marine sediment metagenome]|uniref:Tyr recombinase domain-containing protein n=1 Tax=marine sediment metagenome TaxID=412755 RepID=A0A0F9N522_9ZZZZ